MSASSSFVTRHFPVRRDRWDTVDFYLATGALLVFSVIAIVGSVSTVILASGSNAPTLIYSLYALSMAIMATVKLRKKWVAEEYTARDDALVFEYGYRQLRVPYDEIVAVHPIRVCRLSLTLKPAHRIIFRKPIESERVADAYPLDSEQFLEELAVRCPHLEREGERMFPHASANTTASQSLASSATSVPGR